MMTMARPPKVLVVDDVVAERRLLRRVLDGSGAFEVTGEAGDGVEAIEQARALEPDLVLLDLSMPRMDGLEALPLVREAAPGACVVVLSGFGADLQERPALALGAAGYVEKGMHPSQLIARLVSIMKIEGGARVASGGRDQEERARTGPFVGGFEPEILDALHEGVVVQDATNQIRLCNPSAARILGLQRDELTGTTSFDPRWEPVDADGKALDPAAHPTVLAISTGAPQMGRTIGIRKPDGELAWMLVNAVPLFGREGTRPIGVVASFVDVTEKRRAEDRTLALLEAAADGIVLVGRDGVIRAVNAQTERLFGYERAALIGQPVEQLLPERFRAGHPRFRSRFVDEGLPRPMGSGPGSLYARRADGSEFPVEISLGMVQGPDDESVCASIRDVTDQVAADVVLHELAAVVNAAPMAIFAQGLDGTVLSWNPGAVTTYGWPAEEMVGRPSTAVVPADRRDEHAELVRRAGAGERIERVDIEHLHQDGHRFPVSLSLAPIRDSHDRIIAVAAASFDLTEQARIREELARQQAELARSNAELEQFAYVASHDLTEPLRVIAGFVGLMEQDLGERLGADVLEYMSHIQGGVSRMQALIRDLLTYSRVGQASDVNDRVDLASTVDGVVAVLHRTIVERGAAVEIASLPAVLGNRTELQQLFQNLLANALKFVPKERAPHVRVHSSHEPDGTVTVVVEDNGIGIDAANAERIFLVFQRLHHRSEYPGTGIGLAICKKVVEHHGGEISVDASPDLGGARFTVRGLRPA